MNYKLYYAEGTASMGVRVLLEEIGAPYELLSTTTLRDMPRPPEQLRINPNGWVPVLVWDDGAMYECAAIIIFLCDQHREINLAPAPNSPLRSLFLQTLVYFSSSVQTAFQQDYHPYRFADTVEDEPGIQRRGQRRLAETLQVVDNQIGEKKWILGEYFSAADIYLYMLSTWLEPSREHPALSNFPNVQRIAQQTSVRPSVKIVYG
ncbi:glutathione S-transferase family protein [Paracoccaceae bacterium]|jgi:glutathione S-transferase|nr:glutathione S-transferase [Marinovum sp.]MDB3930306.1 glutathione S-transferase family protein [Paracoccaceae bacterium]|tara:strand:- start:268 stop:885 length:618 start_codon:yes stop_codon:yes gene_type:complete